MSAGDIVRLNRMYNCPSSVPSTIAMDEGNPTQITNGVAIERVGLNKVEEDNNNNNNNNTSSDDDLSMVAESKDDIDVGSNETVTSDDYDDDMILSKEQIDALYSLNAVKRNGLKSAFHHWPLGFVAFEIDPTFRKDFTAF